MNEERRTEKNIGAIEKCIYTYDTVVGFRCRTITFHQFHGHKGTSVKDTTTNKREICKAHVYTPKDTLNKVRY